MRLYIRSLTLPVSTFILGMCALVVQPASAQIEVPILGLGIASIEPDQRGVLSADDGTSRVLMPGRHFYNARSGDITVYDMRETQHSLTGAFMIQDCPTEITAVYAIGDALLFHDLGRDPDMAETLDSVAIEFLDADPAMSEASLNEVLAPLQTKLQQAAGDALNILRVTGDHGTCTPTPSQRPRTMIRRESMTLPDLPPVAEPNYRTEILDFEAESRDGLRVLIEGAAVVYDVADSRALEQCLLDSSADPAAERRFVTGVIKYVREAIGQSDLADLPSVLSDLSTMKAVSSGSRSASCGLASHSIDFTASALTRLTVINCDETSESSECMNSK